MPLTQADVNAAVQQLLTGPAAAGPPALKVLRDGISTGEIIVQAGDVALRLRAAPPDSPLVRALEELRAAAGQPTLAVIASAVGVSEASISRLFAGQRRAGAWPMIRLLVEYLGGDVADYRRLWEQARTSRRPGA